MRVEAPLKPDAVQVNRAGNGAIFSQSMGLKGHFRQFVPAVYPHVPYMEIPVPIREEELLPAHPHPSVGPPVGSVLSVTGMPGNKRPQIIPLRQACDRFPGCLADHPGRYEPAPSHRTQHRLEIGVLRHPPHDLRSETDLGDEASPVKTLGTILRGVHLGTIAVVGGPADAGDAAVGHSSGHDGMLPQGK